MILEIIQKTIATRIGVSDPTTIGPEFSFVDDKRLSVEEFYSVLEEIEEKMAINLVDYAWEFDTVKRLAEYITRRMS